VQNSTPYFQSHLEYAMQIRRDLHQHPELGLEEVRTASVIKEKLDEYGIPYECGIAKTGIVASITNGNSDKCIGLRADMDALPMQELNTFGHTSVHAGKMHACGHDGHVVMLLMAAKYLSENKSFDGTVRFIFQPAEESDGGARIMMEEGLFQRFPVDRIFGLHNMPGYEAGKFATKAGPLMAGRDIFDVKITGRGGHAAMPHKGADPVLAAAQIINGLQSIISRTLDPIESAVISVTIVKAGEAYNVIPETVTLGGSVRYFKSETQQCIKEKIEEVSKSIAVGMGCEADVNYTDGYPPTVNDTDTSEFSVGVMKELFGPDEVDTDPQQIMASEDFAFMLQAIPGCYAWIGNGPGENACVLHNPKYDFNDDLLTRGAAYWVGLTERALSHD